MKKVLALFVSALIVLAGAPANASSKAKKAAPGQLQSAPGNAKNFAPGQRQKKSGQAKQFAPGQRN